MTTTRTHRRALSIAAALAAGSVALARCGHTNADAAATQPERRRGTFWLRAVFALGLAVPAAVLDLLSPLGVPVGELPDAWLLLRLGQTLLAFGLGWGLGAVIRPFAPTPAS